MLAEFCYNITDYLIVKCQYAFNILIHCFSHDILSPVLQYNIGRKREERFVHPFFYFVFILKYVIH